MAGVKAADNCGTQVEDTRSDSFKTKRCKLCGVAIKGGARTGKGGRAQKQIARAQKQIKYCAGCTRRTESLGKQRLGKKKSPKYQVSLDVSRQIMQLQRRLRHHAALTRDPQARQSPDSDLELRLKAEAGVPADVLEKVRLQGDALLAFMQTPKAKKGMRKAFYASPAELGRAALAAMRRKRQSGL